MMRQTSARAVVLFTCIFGAYCQITGSWTPSIIGYGVYPSTTRTLTARKPWFTDGTIAGECTDGTRCPLPTACKDGKVVYEGDLTSACTSKTSCFVLTMYERPPNVGPVAYNYGCRIGWPNTAYRQLDAGTTSVPRASSTFDSDSQATPSATASTVASSTSEASITGDSSLSSSSDSNQSAAGDSSLSSTSKGWVAGAVVGPIAGIALIGGLLLFWRRRRRAHGRELDSKQVHELGQPDQRAVEKYSHNEKPTGANGSRSRAELPPQDRPVELPADQI